MILLLLLFLFLFLLLFLLLLLLPVDQSVHVHKKVHLLHILIHQMKTIGLISYLLWTKTMKSHTIFFQLLLEIIQEGDLTSFLQTIVVSLFLKRRSLLLLLMLMTACLAFKSAKKVGMMMIRLILLTINPC